MTTKARTQATQRNDSNAQAATPKPKREPHRVQVAVLGALKNRRVTMRLLDGTEVCGVLRAVDTYTLALQADGSETVDLWFKQAVASVRAAEGDAGYPARGSGGLEKARKG